MSELFDKSIRTLELPRVLQLLADQAVSEEAKALALAVRPETDYEDVLRRELDGLDDDFATLKLLSQELSFRAQAIRAKKAA